VENHLDRIQSNSEYSSQKIRLLEAFILLSSNVANFSGTTLGSYMCGSNIVVSCLETWDADMGRQHVPLNAIPHLISPRSHAIAVSQSVSSGGGSRGVTSGGGGSSGGSNQRLVCADEGVRGGSSRTLCAWPLGTSWMREDEDMSYRGGGDGDDSGASNLRSAGVAGSESPTRDINRGHKTLLLLGTEVPNVPEEETGVARGSVIVLHPSLGNTCNRDIARLASVALPDPVTAVSGLPGTLIAFVGAGLRLIAYVLVRHRSRRDTATHSPSTAAAQPGRSDAPDAYPLEGPSSRKSKVQGKLVPPAMPSEALLCSGSGWKLKRLTWVWLSSPVTQISTAAGCSLVAVKHQQGHVTMFEYVGTLSGGPMLKVGPLIAIILIWTRMFNIDLDNHVSYEECVFKFASVSLTT